MQENVSVQGIARDKGDLHTMKKRETHKFKVIFAHSEKKESHPLLQWRNY